MRRNSQPAAEEKKDEGFSLIVQHRDPKTGAIVREDPYILRRVSNGAAGGVSSYWERPAGSGNLFNKRNQPIGRWDKTQPEGKRFIKDAPHIAWEPPLTEDQKVSKENAALKAELAALKAEQAKKAQPQKKDQGA